VEVEERHLDQGDPGREVLLVERTVGDVGEVHMVATVTEGDARLQGLDGDPVGGREILDVRQDAHRQITSAKPRTVRLGTALALRKRIP